VRQIGETHDSEIEIRQYRLYSRKKEAKSGKRRNLGTFKQSAAEAHEKAVSTSASLKFEGREELLREISRVFGMAKGGSIRLTTDVRSTLGVPACWGAAIFFGRTQVAVQTLALALRGASSSGKAANRISRILVQRVRL